MIDAATQQHAEPIPDKKVTVTFSLPESTLKALQEYASREQRSRSNMADILLNQAMKEDEV